MGSDAAEEHPALEPLERHPVIVADAQLPDAGSPLHLFDLEGGMAGIGDKALQGVDGSRLNLGG